MFYFSSSSSVTKPSKPHFSNDSSFLAGENKRVHVRARVYVRVHDV